MIIFLLVICVAALLALNVQTAMHADAFYSELRAIRFTLGHLSSDMDNLVGHSHLLHIDAEMADAKLLDIAAGLTLLRGTLESVIRVGETPSIAALESPQVPRPHGEPATLNLRNEDGTIAHEVTWHRAVPSTHAYGGRVFTLLGQNESGSWDFAPV